MSSSSHVFVIATLRTVKLLSTLSAQIPALLSAAEPPRFAGVRGLMTCTYTASYAVENRDVQLLDFSFTTVKLNSTNVNKFHS